MDRIPFGIDQMIISYERQQIDQNNLKYQMLLKEKIVKVQRNCQSLFKCIPSGILTPLSWIIGGVAVRHEYILLETINHLATIELKQNKGDYYVDMQIFDYDKNFAKFLTKEREWNRELDSLTKEEIGDLDFFQVHKFLGIVLVCWKGLNMFKKGKYEVLFKNCKNLSRAICCFCAKDPNIDSIMQSILGLYTDWLCDYVKRTEIQWILDYFYNQTISSVTKIRTVMSEIHKLRSKKEDDYEVLNWNII
ncbi:unnamed protein product (macronuclear) [Paramecium tetraurelia]|uniref:Uncharacterized protein n=1 Tax=Paramecium tetraurelia TaxID=5888 RepID=A0CC25_PARTE|nr:uncharacterized protein GSPATT00037126001 [Paramecium tetraurelia]CAK68342.1 unnamed protein product [Paramecium tetraurelia]|eukprot:XP_001435739.1 hypothetical protein (macronuclear) [Paramecium tetraurelia strain d4-2]